MDKFIQLLKPVLTELTTPVGIAVSGGADSIALLHLCAKISKNIVALHINHQTRLECAEEASFIKKTCDLYTIPFVELKAEGLDLSMANFEDIARQKRYQLLLEYAQQNHINTILTAHHRDDVIENIFLKILRSSLNIFIPEKRSLDREKSIWIKRPLLTLTKFELQSFLIQNNLEYKEDISNQDTTHLRNFLRKNIIPQFYNKIDGFYKKMQTLVNLRQDEEDFFIQYTKNKEEEIFPQNECDVNTFLKEHKCIQARILQNKMIKWIEKPLSYKNLQSILIKIQKNTSHSMILWEDQVNFLVKEAHKIRFFCENQVKSLEKNVIIVHNKKIYLQQIGYEIKLQKGFGIVYTLNDEIYLRSIHPEEKFPWNKGTKLINKILKDKKIARSQRNFVRIIVKNEQKIGIICKDFVYIHPEHRVCDSKMDGLLISQNI